MAKLINPKAFKDFLDSSTGGGIILFACLILSLIIANSPLSEAFDSLLGTHLGVENNNIDLRYTISEWINDGLMVIFFLLVGLEIKRELVDGELSSPRQAALPIIAAMGGAVVPALIYTLFNAGTETHHGWGIPMATDIAFALAVISMLGKRAPTSLKVFLAALAIVDDLLAILVIAIFYSTELYFTYLLYAGAILLLLIGFNRFGVKSLWAYLIPGVFMWYFIHHSGIHATIAGVLVAMTIPTSTKIGGTSPLEKLEHAIAKPVTFIIIPLFAIANTAITFSSEMVGGLTSNMGLGIMVGLFMGKVVGIFGTSFLCIKSGLAQLPDQARWLHLVGVGMLGGIGFTMSIFVSLLSFDNPLHVEEAKLAVLVGSLISGLCGYFFLRALGKKTV